MRSSNGSLVSVAGGRDAIALSGTNAAFARVLRATSNPSSSPADRRIVDLSLGAVEFPLDAELKAQAEESVGDPACLPYTPALGAPHIRAGFAEFLSPKMGMDLTAGHVALTAAAKSALFFILFSMFKNCHFALPIPTWGTFAEQVKAVGGRLEFIRTTPETDYFPTPRQIREAYAEGAKVFIFCYPGNPHGLVPCAKQFAEVMAVLRRLRHRDRRVCVILDTSYSKLVFPGQRCPEWWSSRDCLDLFHRGALIDIHPFSKTCAVTGWRVGMVLARPDRIDALGGALSRFMGCTCVPMQHAAWRALEREDHISSQIVPQLHENALMVRRVLGDTRHFELACMPHGGIFCLVRCNAAIGKRLRRREITDATALSHALLDRFGLGVIPGEVFLDEVPSFRLLIGRGNATVRAGLEILRDADTSLGRSRPRRPTVAA